VRKLVKRTILGLGVLFLLLAVAAWVFPRWFLTVDSGPVNAEVIVLLGGGSHERYERAVKLFEEHAASRVIVSGYGDSGINRYLLVKAGVPAQAIQLEDKSRTTRENAQFTIRLLREQKVKQVIIVTSWYHSRRALACFEHYAPEIQFYSRPCNFDPVATDKSRHRTGSRARLEYVKLMVYWMYYGVSPF
jgi:uncharacterized SAM-binding protein YcdF (DUF218 family)